MGLQTIINYDTPANFTYDNSLIEIVGGKAQLKSQVDPDETLYGNFVTKNLHRVIGGSTLGTLGGAAVTVSGKLNLKGVAGDWTHDPTGQVGLDGSIATFRFRYTPDQTGIPPLTQTIFTEQKTSISNHNLIQITHNAGTGNLAVLFRDQIGAGKGTLTTIAGWLPNVGTEYELELNIDTENGYEVLSVNGVLSANHATVFTRSADIAYNRFGNIGAVQKFEIDEYQRFTAVKHTAPFPLEIPRTTPESVYSLLNPTILTNSSFGAEEITGFLETTTKPGVDEIRYTMVYAGADYYLVAGLPVISNGTYTETNTLAEIQAGLPVDISPDANVQLKAFIHSADGMTTPDITSNTIDYNFYSEMNALGCCNIWGYVYDNKVPVEGAVYTFKLKKVQDLNGNWVEIDTSVTTDVNGYFKIELVETATSNTKINVKLSFTNSQGKNVKRSFKIIVPDQGSIPLDDAKDLAAA